MNTKICPKCNQEKQVESNFYKLLSGYSSYCKDCVRKSSKLYSRIYRSKHKDEINKAHREQWKKEWKKDPTKLKEKAKKYNQKLREQVLTHYGKKCKCCGETEIKFLCIDHINGGGTKHRKQVGGGLRFYCWLRKNNYPKDFQTLCHNCNFAKSCFGQCPHKGRPA